MTARRSLKSSAILCLFESSLMSSSTASPQALSSASVVATNSVTQRFGNNVALDQVNVDIATGVTGLVGANGAGKTTLMNAVMGLRKPTSGTLKVLGHDPFRSGPELRAMLGFAPERNVLPDEMRAVDFVRHMAEVRGLPKVEARNRASDMLWLVGLGEERFRTLGTMSTGQRQRAKLAQAIASDPSLVLLDEPTDGLDPVQRSEMLNLIRQIAQEFSMDVLLSSHLLEEVEKVCDNVVVLDGGKLVASGAIADLIGDDEGLALELVDFGELAPSVDAVVDALQAAGFTLDRRNGHIGVFGASYDVLCDHVRDAVADAGARISRMSSRRRSLEHLFELSES